MFPTSGRLLAWCLMGSCLVPLCRLSEWCESTCRAEDRVTIRPESGTGRIALVGDIVTYNDEGLSFRVQATGEVQRIPPARIELLETYRNEAHLRAIAALAEGRTTDAIEEGSKALETEKRLWLRHEILGLLIQAHRRRQEWEPAVARFVEIVSEEPHCREWRMAPLAWEPISVSESLRQRCRRWLTSSHDSVRLVAASILSADPESAAAAKIEIDRIARTGDSYLQGLAQAHQRQTLMQSGEVSEIELARWKGDIERMPESIRAGPWYVLGQAHLRRQELDEAIAALLWLPTVHQENEPLAARATYESARIFERRNQPTHARRLYEEILARYPWSTYTSEARAALTEKQP
ncbi:MAG: hypothetical protein R3C01_07810 [Planctomycetaceae bacterium]